MKMTDIPFGTTDWSTIPCTEHAGITVTPRISHQVADHAEAHRSSTAVGAKLFIVD